MDNVFQQAALSLIDDHYKWLKSEKGNEFKQSHGSIHFAHEFRTLHLGGRRQAGHSTLIKQLSFDIGRDVGHKYSTFIITPSPHMADHNYRDIEISTDEETYDSKLAEAIANDYAREYYNVMVNRMNSYRHGKALPRQHLCSVGFSSRSFLSHQRDAILKLTGKEIKKFDLCLVDGITRFTPEEIDQIYGVFADEVELFVFLQ